MNPTQLISVVIRLMEYFFHIHLLIAIITYGIIATLFRKHFKHVRFRAINHEKLSFERLNAPKVTFLIPVFNNAEGIIDSVDAALWADYPNFNVIVINDGSDDQTLKNLIRSYSLSLQTPLKRNTNLSKSPIINAFQSQSHSNLMVIDKTHSGKADSLNIGIDLCDSELICCMDSDSIITPDSMRKLVTKFIDEPSLVALGGAISPSNEIIVQNGEVIRRKSSQPVFVGVQIIEYLRSFTSWRTGWSYLDGLLIIGGALTLFKRQAIVDIGGYNKDSVCEDLEIILSLHQHFMKYDIPYHVWTIPDVICWTRAPTSVEELKRQRMRWMYGALQSLKEHRGLAFNNKSPIIGWMAFPHLIFIESLAPILELLGLICFVSAFAFGLLSFEAFFIYGFLIFSITGFFSWYSIAINDAFISSFKSLWQVIRLGCIGLIEPLGYRQRESYWRMYAWWKWITKRKIEW